MRSNISDLCPETKKQVRRYAILAKLMRRDCPVDEEDGYVNFFNEKDFKDVVCMIQSLESIDTEGIPERFMFFDDEHHRNIREDVVSDGEIRDIVMLNAQQQSGYFTVPKVIDKDIEYEDG